jgi:hypothetical protein
MAMASPGSANGFETTVKEWNKAVYEAVHRPLHLKEGGLPGFTEQL